MKDENKQNEDHMDVTQYRSLVDLLNSNSEDQYRALKALKNEFGEKLDLNMKFIGSEINDMKTTLQKHNSRLRKAEEREIRLEERNATLKDVIKTTNDSLEKQKQVCSAQIMKTNRLKTVDSWLEWITKHPYKTIGIMLAVLSIVLTVSNVLYHLIKIGGN